MTTANGLKHAMNLIIQANARHELIMLWGALPCTGGSPWQNYNKKFPTAAAKIRIHIKIFKKLFDNFKLVAREVIRSGG